VRPASTYVIHPVSFNPRSGYISSSRSSSLLPSYRCACPFVLPTIMMYVQCRRDPAPSSKLDAVCSSCYPTFGCLDHHFSFIHRRRKCHIPTPRTKSQSRAPHTRVRLFFARHKARTGGLCSIFSLFVQSLISPKHNALYTSPPCGTINASVWDLSSASLPPGLTPCSADILVLVFVLSALHPSEWPRVISNIAQVRVSVPSFKLLIIQLYTLQI